MLIFPFIIPIIIMVICGIIQIYSLLKKSLVTDPAIISKQRRITLTILLITVLCLVCSTPYTVLDLYNEYVDDLNKTVGSILIYTFSTVLPFVNASLNPVILITRGIVLRSRIKMQTRSIVEMFRSYKSTKEERNCAIENMRVSISTLKDARLLSGLGDIGCV